MLDKQIFLKAIQQLSNYYLKFELNQQQAETWYQACGKYTNDEFKQMCLVYMDQCEFAPQSPASLKAKYNDEMKKQISTKEVSPDRGWEIAIEAIRLHGLSYEWNVKKALDYIKENGNEELVIVTQQYFRELENLQSNDTFLMNNFKKSYEIMLKRKVEDKHLELTNTVIKNLLGNAEGK